MGKLNVDELQRIMGTFIVTAAKEYDVPTVCNLGEFQMNLEELERIMDSIPR